MSPATESSRGLLFEQFEVGMTIQTPARTLTEADVVAFAGLSGDYNPLHTDAEFARLHGFGERVAHGMLGLSVATGLAARLGFLDGTALAFLSLDWKFRRPILFGDTVVLDLSVARARPAAAMGGGIVTFDVRMRNQRGEIVQKGTWDVLVRASDEANDGNQ
jgi:acyl dehydratase